MTTNSSINANQLLATSSSPSFVAVTAGNLNLSANSLISTNTNGNIDIIPNGSGSTGGIVLAGNTTAIASANNGLMQLISTTTNAIYSAYSGINNAANVGGFRGYKSRGGAPGVFAAVQSGDSVAIFQGVADDGTSLTNQVGLITIDVSGSVSTGIVPGLMTFRTTNVSGVLTTAMSISNAQVVSLTNPLLPASGGTGTATAPSAGQIPIGNSGGTYTPAAINSGTNITVANGSATITVNLSGIIAPTLGGTGVNNGSNTLTLAGNLATSGAFASTFTMTGATSVTFPTSGTLATTAALSGYVQLNPGSNQIITTGRLSLSNGIFFLGSASGSTVEGSTQLIAFSPTTNLGSFIFKSTNNAGNFNVTLTNASFGQASTITIPDPGSASANVLLSGVAINSVPSITFSSTSGIIGTTTNDSAAAGSVGQIISSQILNASAVGLSTATPTSLISISLTAGDWDIWGNVIFSGDGTTLIQSVIANIGVNANTLEDRSTAYSMVSNTSWGSLQMGGPVPMLRASVSGTTTYYLTFYGVFSVSTLTACGGLYARRRR